MSLDDRYSDWLAARRDCAPSSEFADRVMKAVGKRTEVTRSSAIVRLCMWIDRSHGRRLAACLGAFAIGSVPLLFLAYLSTAPVF